MPPSLAAGGEQKKHEVFSAIKRDFLSEATRFNDLAISMN